MKTKKQRLSDLPPQLRGLSNNRWGGHSSGHMRGFKGAKYGAASPVKYIHLSPKELAKYETFNPPIQ